jgi:hypothetical protein
MSFFDDPAGPFELTSVKDLPNAQVAYPGERWSNRKASGAITPGEPVVPLASGSSPTGTLVMRPVKNGDAATQLALATRVIDIPDPNQGPTSLSPNAVRNQDIPNKEYLLAHYSGVFIMTLVTPDTYAPGELIGWDLNGARPAGKATTHEGAWTKNASADIKSVFEVMDWQEVNSSTHEGILTVRFAGRNQF